jgi:hypothetical protein
MVGPSIEAGKGGMRWYDNVLVDLALSLPQHSVRLTTRSTLERLYTHKRMDHLGIRSASHCVSGRNYPTDGPGLDFNCIGIDYQCVKPS